MAPSSPATARATSSTSSVSSMGRAYRPAPREKRRPAYGGVTVDADQDVTVTSLTWAWKSGPGSVIQRSTAAPDRPPRSNVASPWIPDCVATGDPHSASVEPAAGATYTSADHPVVVVATRS